MIARPLAEIAATVRGDLRGSDAVVTGVATDSRLVEPGDLFVALAGEHRDGHDFVGDALRRGAVGTLGVRAVEGAWIQVDDAGRALLDLAADDRRRRLEMVVIAVTGANGKTSTKDLATGIIRTRFRTHASPASFNNEIGLPVTLLGAPPDTEVVVAEMGARRGGDVRTLCEIARPEIAVVTNIGVAHMEIFGSWEEIVASGAEPVEWLSRDGVVILNADDSVVRGYAARTQARVVLFGADAGADVRAEDVSLDVGARARFVLEYGGDREPVELEVPGEHMVANALAAAACGLVLGSSLAECAAALKAARISAGRMETFTTPTGVMVLNDSYNANPESMAAGLKAARRMAAGGRLVAVLGHMAELGPISMEAHERVGELIVRIGVDRLITVGDHARSIARAAVREGLLPEDSASYEEPSEAVADILDWTAAGDVVFVKGSRAAALERVAEALR